MGLGAYEYCLQKRRLEKVHMKRAVEIIDRKKGEKEAQMQASREARRKAREEKERAEEEAKKSSWKFW
jgi:cytochrome c oxidase assembly protein subunit 20